MKLISRKSIRKFYDGGQAVIAFPEIQVPQELQYMTTPFYQNLQGKGLYMLPERYYVDHPEYRKLIFVRASDAEKRNMPFAVDTSDSNGNFLYDYGILHQAGGEYGKYSGIEVQNPELTFFGVDPYTGKILNGERPNGDSQGQPAVAITGINDMVQVDPTWTYIPEYGWQKRPYQGEITEAPSPYSEMSRNFLSTLGYEHAYEMPDAYAENLGSDIAETMIDGAAMVLTDNALATVGKYLSAAPKVGQIITRYPRTSAFIGNSLAYGAPAVAEAVMDVKSENAKKNLDTMENYLSNISTFTFEDFNSLAKTFGSEERAVQEILRWLTNNGYVRTPVEGENPIITKNYYLVPGDKEFLSNSGPEVTYGGYGLYTLRKNLKQKEQRTGKNRWRNADGTRTKAGKAKNVVGWIINTGIYAGTRWFLLNQSKRNEIAQQMVEYLLKKGYIQSGASYDVVEDQYTPQITSTQTQQAEIQDSAATPTPYGETTGGTTDVGSFNQNWNQVSVREPNDTTNQ